MEPKDPTPVPSEEEKTPERGPSEVEDTDLDNSAGGRAQPMYGIITTP